MRLGPRARLGAWLGLCCGHGLGGRLLAHPATPTTRSAAAGRPIGSGHARPAPRQRRLHGRGDRAGAARRAAGMLLVCALSGAPGSLVLATVLAALPGGPAGRLLPVAGPLRAGAPTLLAAGLLWGGFVATAAALLRRRASAASSSASATTTSLAIVAPVTEEASKGALPAAAAVVAAGGARRHPRRHRLRRHGRRRLRLRREHPLPRRGLQRHRRHRARAAPSALTGTFVVRCLFSPFAHPLFTTFTGIGVGIAVSSRRPARAPRARAAGRVPASPSPPTPSGTARRSTASTASSASTCVLMAPAFLRRPSASPCGRAAPSAGCSPPRSATPRAAA